MIIVAENVETSRNVEGADFEGLDLCTATTGSFFSMVAGPRNWCTQRIKEHFENINTVCVGDGCWTLDMETSG